MHQRHRPRNCPTWSNIDADCCRRPPTSVWVRVMSALIKESQLGPLPRWSGQSVRLAPAGLHVRVSRQSGSAGPPLVNGRDSVARDSRPHRFYRLTLADAVPRSPKSLTLHTSSTRGAPRTVWQPRLTLWRRLCSGLFCETGPPSLLAAIAAQICHKLSHVQTAFGLGRSIL